MSGDTKESKDLGLDLGSEKSMKRDHDSTDDFEHLEHDGLSAQETRQAAFGDYQQQPAPLTQLLDADVSRVDLIDISETLETKQDLMDISKTLEANLMKSNVPLAQDNELRSVPATPPPSADLESSDPFEGPLVRPLQAELVDSKAASMAFMETERNYGTASHRNTPWTEGSDAHGEVRSAGFDNGNDRAAEDGNFADGGFSLSPNLGGPARSSIDLLTGSAHITGDSSILPDKYFMEESVKGKAEGLCETGATYGRTQAALLTMSDPIDAKEVKPLVPELPPLLQPTKTNNAGSFEEERVEPKGLREEFLSEIKSSVLPEPQTYSAEKVLDDDEAASEEKPALKGWLVMERPLSMEMNTSDAPWTRPLPPLPKEAELENTKSSSYPDKFEMSNDFILGEGVKTSVTQPQGTGNETGDSDSEFESEAEASPAKTSSRQSRPEVSQPEEKLYVYRHSGAKLDDIEIAPKEIFRDMGLDAWFNPERLNPQVAALIYWREPEKSGIVFGAILSVLLSLAYFSLISVLAYFSLLTLFGTVSFRIYKTILQAIRKTSDGHPFKDVLETDLNLSAERVHEVADVAVAHANAAVSELRRLFFVEDFVDSLKFGVLLWCLTYVGYFFNGMTLIIIGVVALFTLPKLYEMNKAQVDQNMAMVKAKINELTVKIKAAVPLGKKPEPTKEE